MFASSKELHESHFPTYPDFAAAFYMSLYYINRTYMYTLHEKYQMMC